MHSRKPNHFLRKNYFIYFHRFIVLPWLAWLLGQKVKAFTNLQSYFNIMQTLYNKTGFVAA